MGAANRKIGIIHGSRQDKPDMCRNGRIDAITQVSNGTIYAFQGRPAVGKKTLFRGLLLEVGEI